MPREKKTQIIDSLQEAFSRCSVGILTDYRGLSASDITELRHKLRESGIEYRVVKNTLAQFAAERAGKNQLGNLFHGPVAITFGYGDIVKPAKVLADYIRTAKTTLDIKGGFLNDRLLSAEDVMNLATLPAREVIIAKIIAGLQSPISALLNCLTNPLREITGVLQARIKQMEKG